MRGQTIIEYILIVGILITALYVMGPAMKRGVQSVIKGTADQIAAQKDAEQDFSADAGHLDYMNSKTKANNSKEIRQRGAATETTLEERSETFTNSLTNLGFSPE